MTDSHEEHLLRRQRSDDAAGPVGTPLIAGLALVLAVLTLDQATIRYGEGSLALLACAGIALLVSPQMPQTAGVLLQRLGRLLLLGGLGVMIIPPGELSTGRLVVLARILQQGERPDRGRGAGTSGQAGILWVAKS